MKLLIIFVLMLKILPCKANESQVKRFLAHRLSEADFVVVAKHLSSTEMFYGGVKGPVSKLRTDMGVDGMDDQWINNLDIVLVKDVLKGDLTKGTKIPLVYRTYSPRQLRGITEIDRVMGFKNDIKENEEYLYIIKNVDDGIFRHTAPSKILMLKVDQLEKIRKLLKEIEKK